MTAGAWFMLFVFVSFILKDLADMLFPEERDRRIYERTVKDIKFGRWKK